MAVPAAVNRLLSLMIDTGQDLRQSTLPANVTGVTVTGAAGANTKGVYAQIAASVGANDALLIGILAVLNAVDEYHIDLARGAAAAEVNLVTDWPMERQEATAVGQNIYHPSFFPFGFFIVNGTRLAADLATVGGGADTAEVSAIILTGF